jgi:hypothetical protein
VGLVFSQLPGAFCHLLFELTTLPFDRDRKHAVKIALAIVNGEEEEALCQVAL